MPLSARTWTNGSTTPLGGVETSGVVQQRSKSPAEMILLSTKILSIVGRPSSTSGPAGLPLFFLMKRVWSEVVFNDADSAIAGWAERLLALLSMSFSAVWTSG